MVDFSLEAAAPAGPVAGLDEAGRGPLAGPVIAACVCVPAGSADVAVWQAIADSKRLSRRRRETLVPKIEAAAATAIGRAEVAEIDRLNIQQASFLAMQRALAALPGPTPGHLLVDGNRLPEAGFGIDATAVVKGDARSTSVAAASILAKVYRDREMAALDAAHPGYGLARNQGYPTPEHRRALQALGPSPAHRRSFSYQPALPL